MGLDLVYWDKRAGLRSLFIILSGSLCMMLFSMLLLPYDALAGFAVIAVYFGLVFGLLGIEYRRGHSFVKGKLDGISMSDITKAIYWLSYIGADRIPGLGGQGYWKKVRKVASKINGDFLSKWQSIEDRYTTSLTWMFRPATSLLLFQDTPEERDIARQLAQTLISWVSERTDKPIYVIVGDEGFDGIKRVGTVRRQPIVEIGPKRLAGFNTSRYESQETSLFQSVPYFSKRKELAAYATLHILLGLIAGTLVFSAWQKMVLAGPMDRDALVVGFMGVLAFGFGQYLIYSGLPVFLAYFKEQISPSELHKLVKRTPKMRVASLYAVVSNLKEKVSLLQETHEKGSVEVSKLKEPIIAWLKLDSEQTLDDRCFFVEGNVVNLTRKGNDLARLVAEKDV